jgi:hypothetical protein
VNLYFKSHPGNRKAGKRPKKGTSHARSGYGRTGRNMKRRNSMEITDFYGNRYFSSTEIDSFHVRQSIILIAENPESQGLRTTRTKPANYAVIHRMQFDSNSFCNYLLEEKSCLYQDNFA